ncbi:MAG: hypothetical protein ACOC2W_04485 [bacterium]
MDRIKATELYNQFIDSVKRLDKIKMKINERFHFLHKEYGDIIKPSINDLEGDNDFYYIEKIKYIKEVEKHIETQNKFVQLNLFDK